jgi:predicted DsbA family dithiol-disulfide isomerase
MRIFYDYECPYCKRGYEYLLELIGRYPEIEIEWLPVEAHPRPENHFPHTDLAGQGYYSARELGADMAKFHTRMFQAVSVERRNVEETSVLADIVKDLVDGKQFRAILESKKYAGQIDKNNDLAYEREGVWAVPAFRMIQGDTTVRKLDSAEGVGVSREQIRDFLSG